jgi:hypothetical protein
MIKNIFDFKKQKTPIEALVFYGVCVVVFMVLSAAADHFIGGRL